MKNNNTLSISSIIDSFGVNKFTWYIFFFLGFAMVFDGYDYMIVSYTMPQIAEEWGLSDVAKGSLSSWSLFGLILGGAISGILSDKFGRKKVLVGSIAIYSLLNIPIFFSPNFAFFATFRVLAGIGLGACIPTVTTVFSESTPTRYRALFITFGMAWMIVGWVAAGLIATAVVPTYGWRICYLIGGIPFLYSIFLHFKMHETSHWLASKGRKDDAIKVLQYIERTATGKVSEYDPAVLTVPPKSKVVGPKALFTRAYIITTLGVWITYFCGCLTVYGVNAWLPSFMMAKGFEIKTSYVLSTAQNAAAVIANCSTGFVAELIGRRKNLIGSYVLGIISVVIMAYVGGSVGAVLAANIFLGFAINYSITAVQPLMAEGYPTDIRNTGVSWCQAFGRLGGALGPIITGWVVSLNMGISTAFLFYTIPLFVGMLAAIFFVKKETKGKTIDEITAENVMNANA